MTAKFKGLTIANCLVMLLLLVLLGCGTKNVGIMETGQLALDRQSAGVTVGGFEVLRYNQEGFTDPALNGTIGVEVAREGALTALTVSVTDTAQMNSAIVNVNYDSSKTHPERAEFHGLLGGEGQVLDGAFLDSPGVAGLGEAPIGNYQPGTFSGDLVTVYFAAGPAHSVSAIGDVNHNPNGVAKQFQASDTSPANLFAESDTGASTANVSWSAAWHCGDGDQNSETNAADLVPLALFFGQSPSSNWASEVADYDLNGEVNVSDIQRIGVFFGELTNTYLVEAADNDGSGRTEVASVSWKDDYNDPTGGADGELKSVFRYWEVDFDSASAFTYGQLAALDANTDGTVTLYVTPVGSTAADKGAESSIDVTVGGPPPTAKSMIITDFDVEVIGATDGAGGDVFDGDGNTTAPDEVTIENANSQVTLKLNSIRGTFQGVNFDKDNLATDQGMTQAHYDEALASARALAMWHFDHGGAPGFRRTTDWINLDSGNPNPAPFDVTGDPGQGTIFPDYDPESVGPDAEGKLSVTLPFGNQQGAYYWGDDLHVAVLADKKYDLTVDIQEDESAPVLVSYSGSELKTIINQQFTIQFDWGDGGDPGVYDNVKLQLLRIQANGIPDPGGIVNLTYVDGQPVAGNEFSLRLTGINTLECIVSGAGLQLGSNYAFRFNDGTKWSTINLPEEMLTTAPPPPPQTLNTVPSVVDRTVNYIQIFYDDPVIRRNSFFIIDLFNKQAIPEDQEAYDDVLKINGDEFPVTVVDSGNPPTTQAWPQIVVGPKDGSSTQVDPSIITSIDWANQQPGIIVPVLNGNRIIVDIRVVTGPPQPGDEDEYYAYKLFNADGSAVGQGTFMVPVLPISVPGPTGLGWAINVFNREEKDFGDRDFVDHSLDSSKVGTSRPDIIWTEFQDGWVFSAFETSSDRPYVNVHMNLADNEPAGGTMDVNLSLRVVGLLPNHSYMAIHEVVRDDYFNLVNPGYGILRKGHTYTVALDDNKTSQNPDYTFAANLAVTGDLPPL